MERIKGKVPTATTTSGGASAPTTGTSRSPMGKATSGASGGQKKRSAKKSKYPVIFTDSDTDEEVDVATYRDLRKEWKRLRRENRDFLATAEAHLCELEKTSLVCGLHSEVSHVKGLLKESNAVVEGLRKDLVGAQRQLADSETQLAALRSGWKKRLDELITKDLRIGALEEKVDRLLTEIIPHVYQMTCLNPDAGKRLVELAASPGVRIEDLAPDEIDGSNSG